MGLGVFCVHRARMPGMRPPETLGFAYACSPENKATHLHVLMTEARGTCGLYASVELERWLLYAN